MKRGREGEMEATDLRMESRDPAEEEEAGPRMEGATGQNPPMEPAVGVGASFLASAFLT